MGMPAYKASGTFTAGSGAITPPYPTGGNAPAANDIALLVCESENQAISLSAAQGFAEVPTWSPQSAGTAATNPASRLAVFWKRCVGGDTAPSVADAGDHTTGQIHLFTGVRTSGNPWNTGAGGNDGGVNDTSASIPGATTTVDNCLVALMSSTSFNGTSTAQFSGWTNADLASLTERADNSNTIGLGGGHGLATGEKAIAGTYGATTVTLANTSFKGCISLALEGVAGATFTQALAAIAVGAASLAPVSTFARSLAVTATGIAALATALLFSVSMAVTAAASAAMSKVTTFALALAATAVGAAVLTRIATYSRTLAATATGAAGFTKGMFTSLSATATGVVGLTKGVAKPIAATVTGVAALSIAATFAKTLAAVAAASASLSAQFIAGGAAAAKRLCNWIAVKIGIGM